MLFDLLSGGDKEWGRYPPYRELGYAAAAAAGADFALGSVGAGTGATTVNCKGGIGSASAQTADGHVIGALAAVNAVGSVLVDRGPWFWAAPFEQDGEFGGRGWPAVFPASAYDPLTKGSAAREHHPRHRRDRRHPDQGAGQAPRRHGADRPFARDLSGAYAARRRRGVCCLDRPQAAHRGALSLTTLGAIAANVVARAIARGVFAATALAFSRRAAELERPIWPLRQGS